jgi:predicted methyltransferase
MSRHLGTTNHGATQMAKNKASKGETEAVSNGGLVFEEMDEGFTIPPKVDGGQWDDLVTRLVSAKGSVVKVYETDMESVQRTYTRAKQLKAAAKRAEANITVAVRKLTKDGVTKSVLLAQAN